MKYVKYLQKVFLQPVLFPLGRQVRLNIPLLPRRAAVSVPRSGRPVLPAVTPSQQSTREKENGRFPAGVFRLLCIVGRMHQHQHMSHRRNAAMVVPHTPLLVSNAGRLCRWLCSPREAES